MMSMRSGCVPRVLLPYVQPLLVACTASNAQPLWHIVNCNDEARTATPGQEGGCKLEAQSMVRLLQRRATASRYVHTHPELG